MAFRHADIPRPSARFVDIVLASIALLGLLYLTSKVVITPSFGPEDYVDFKDMWFAGKLWASGNNPYDGALFSNAQHLSTWFYPPYWYPLIVPFGLLPLQLALGIWKAINLSLLIGANYLTARAVADLARKKWLPIFLAGTSYVCFMHATPAALYIGQTSILVYFGISVLIYGLLKRRPTALIVGLVILALKPQIGIVAFAAVAALRNFRWTVIPSAAICLVSSFTIALSANYIASIRGFLANLGRHGEHDANTPQYLTGLIHILNDFLPISGGLLGTLLILSAAMLCAVVIFYFSPINKTEKVYDAQEILAGLALFVAATFFFIPLHFYDMISLVILLMIIIATPLRGRWLIAMGLFLSFRPDYIARVLGIATSSEVCDCNLMSAGLVLVVAGAVWSLLAIRSQANLRSEIGRQAVS